MLAGFFDQNDGGAGGRGVNGLNSAFKLFIGAMPTQKNGPQFGIVFNMIAPVG